MNEYPKQRYGAWSGNPKGYPFNPDRCAYEVGDAWHFWQCHRPSGHGDRALFCKQHAKRHPSEVMS